MENNVPAQSEIDPDLKVSRGANRALYDIETVHAIVDNALIAHVATVRDGMPLVIPMFCVRDGDSLLLHGAAATGTIRRGQKNIDICAEMTVLDGFVLARSAFHHSVNYRSVVVMGQAEPVTGPSEKETALELFVERIMPGRQAELRQTTTKELQGTGVLRLSLAMSSAKVRAGDPIDDDEDYDTDVWAGVVPMTTTFGEPIPDSRLSPGIPLPETVRTLVGKTL